MEMNQNYYFLTNLLYHYVLLSMFLDSGNIMRKEDLTQLMIDDNENNYYQEVLELIYKRYPNLSRGGVDVDQIISSLIGVANKQDVENWNRKQFEDFAGLVADTAIDFFSGYSDIAGAG